VSDLLDTGADIVTVVKMAGHANMQTSARYNRRTEEAKRRAAGVLHVPMGGADWGCETRACIAWYNVGGTRRDEIPSSLLFVGQCSLDLLLRKISNAMRTARSIKPRALSKSSALAFSVFCIATSFLGHNLNLNIFHFVLFFNYSLSCL
jgi:hypothetical protein